MRIEPCDSTLGAVVRDVDLATIDDDAFRRIEAAWHEHAVLLFPGQHLSDADHIAFARRFGRLEMGLKRTAKASVVSLGRISNVDKEGNVVNPEALQARFQRGNQQWHSDSSYKRVGAKASILAAHVVPESGGETEWADLRAAWDALDDSMRDWLRDKEAVHSYRFSHAWHGGLELLNDAELDHLPPSVPSADARSSGHGAAQPLRRAPCQPHRRRGSEGIAAPAPATHQRSWPAAQNVEASLAARRHRHLGHPLRAAQRPPLASGSGAGDGAIYGGRRRCQ